MAVSSPADGKSRLQVRNGAGVVVTTLAVVSVVGAILLAGSPSGAWAEEFDAQPRVEIRRDSLGLGANHHGQLGDGTRT
jgi:hypothetical protein